MNDKTVLEVKNLRTYFYSKEGMVPAVDGISFKVHENEVFCIVGESGCGKTVTSTSILNLIPSTSGKIMEGSSVKLLGKELVGLKEKQMQDIRGNEISMIFQDPMTSFSPVTAIGKQLMEPLIRHKKIDKHLARQEAIALLKKVGITSPESRMKAYPHELSGGMRQRIMIAMALACDPKVLIADEPTTALDVTIQAQILEIILELKEKMNTAIILITHDMGVVADVSDTVMVMYAGNAMEFGNKKQIFKNALHPYTRGLLASIPRLDRKVDFLYSIDGTLPKLHVGMRGCKFASRCPHVQGKCQENTPPLFNVIDNYGKNHKVACWNYEANSVEG